MADAGPEAERDRCREIARDYLSETGESVGFRYVRADVPSDGRRRDDGLTHFGRDTDDMCDTRCVVGAKDRIQLVRAGCSSNREFVGFERTAVAIVHG